MTHYIASVRYCQYSLKQKIKSQIFIKKDNDSDLNFSNQHIKIFIALFKTVKGFETVTGMIAITLRFGHISNFIYNAGIC